MNADVDKFVKKSKQWNKEIEALRQIVLQTKLEEEFKWRLPCYTHNGSNIVIIQPFKASLALMFFKGTLLKDPKKALVDVGPNSRIARRMEFTSAKEIARLKSTIKSYIKQAIALEESGQKVAVSAKPSVMPDELKKALAKNAKLKKAFQALTPGRQRAYILHISSAKQPATRQARIEKNIPLIMQGKGINER